MPNRGAHQRSGRQAVSLTAAQSGEVPCSGARRRDKAERSERRDSRRRSRREQVIVPTRANIRLFLLKCQECSFNARFSKRYNLHFIHDKPIGIIPKSRFEFPQ